jgi:drug/metabolite transporter (DMT)-like permease
MEMKSVIIFGAVLVLVGLIAFAMPSFNTEETKDVVKLGDLKVQAKTEEPHFIPPLVSEGAMLLGILLIGAGVVMNRQ